MEPFGAADSTLFADSVGFAAIAPSPVRILASVVVVLFLMVGVLLLLWGRNGRGRAYTSADDIRVVNQTSLGRRGSIVLVEVDGRRILVGATASHFSPLSEWETLPEEAIVAAELEAPRRAPFDGVLDRVVTKLRLLEGAKG